MAESDTSPPGRQKRAMMRKGALWNERSPWMGRWADISELQQPALGQFLASMRPGAPNYNAVYDETAFFASRTLAAGLMSGATSPARPWFRLTLSDRDLVEYGPVKTWLHRTGILLREIFARSNTYRALAQGYEELGLFGTWSSLVAADFDTVVHHHPMTVGEYALAQNAKGQVDTMARELPMTISQMVERFGRENCSQHVRNLYDRHNLDAWVSVNQIIQPRKDRDSRLRDNRNMPFESIYFETGQDNDKQLLEDSGYKRFPVLAPRWAVKGNQAYGSSPGMQAQGSVRQLQFEQLRKGQAIDYQVNPPLQVPTAYKEAAKSRLPGGIMYVDMSSPTGGIRSAYEVNLNLQHLREDIMDVRERINTAYYADLFLMLANDNRSGVTATEVAERHEEKLLMLGPVLERLDNELYNPLIDITFDMCADAGILPPAPPELEGMDINVEYVSVLAQAQRAVSSQGMDRLFATIGQLSAAKTDPGLWDTVDVDQAIQDYAEAYGVNPELVRDDDQVAELRAQRQQALAAQQAAAAAPMMADTAKTASEVDPEGLTSVMQMFAGYGT